MFLSPVAMAEDVADGEGVFKSTCAGCHHAPDAIQTPATELEARLVTGAIRQHRFQLSDTQVAQVVKYLLSVRR